MKTSYPSFERTSYIDLNQNQIMDRQFMRRCFAHWKQELTAKQKRCKTRIAGWAVLAYAKELYEDLVAKWGYNRKTGEPVKERDLLNGARDWSQYSEGGSSLCYSYQIRERLGQYYRHEHELEIQARFLQCAAYRLLHALAWNQTHNKKEN